mgnify:CR=1 FL=1
MQLIGLAIKRSRAADFFKEKLSGLADLKNGIDGRSAKNFRSDSFWVCVQARIEDCISSFQF